MRNFFLTSMIICNVVSAFVIDRPSNSLRIDETQLPATATVSPTTGSSTVIPKQNFLSAPRLKIEELDSVDEYVEFLEEDDRLCMIKFHAPHCKACQKFGMQYKRIGKEIGDITSTTRDGSEIFIQEGEIRMAEMEYGANKELCKSLGIKKLPSVHFYSRGKLVDGFPCAPSKIGMLLNRLEEYRDMSPAELEFEADMNQGAALGASVLQELITSANAQETESTQTLR